MSGINDDLFPSDRARDAAGKDKHRRYTQKKQRERSERNVLCSTCMLYRLEHAPSMWRRHNPVKGSPRS